MSTQEKEIETSISTLDVNNSLSKCDEYNFMNLKKLLMNVYGIFNNPNEIRVMLLCNWLSSQELCNLWNKMSKNNDYTWGNIKIVWEEPCSYYVVINSTNIEIDTTKCILFQMEPNMSRNSNMWKEWSNPDKTKFLKIISHDIDYNNNEWHLAKTYKQLSTEYIKKTINCNISIILSDKYADIGHIKRIDFVKYLDEKDDINVDVFGNNKYNYKNYIRGLPYHSKEEGLYPYKYTFNAENHEIYNYYTEKLIDAILSECLCFYWGCPNINSLIDDRAYVKLELENFEHDYQIIKNAISDNLWEKRLPYIKMAKQRILNEKQFFPRLQKIISEIK